MAGRQRAPAAASSYLPPVMMTAVLFLWVFFSCKFLVNAEFCFFNLLISFVPKEELWIYGTIIMLINHVLA
jgi:hypothetical protein